MRTQTMSVLKLGHEFYLSVLFILIFMRVYGYVLHWTVSFLAAETKSFKFTWLYLPHGGFLIPVELTSIFKEFGLSWRISEGKSKLTVCEKAASVAMGQSQDLSPAQSKLFQFLP